MMKILLKSKELITVNGDADCKYDGKMVVISGGGKIAAIYNADYVLSVTFDNSESGKRDGEPHEDAPEE